MRVALGQAAAPMLVGQAVVVMALGVMEVAAKPGIAFPVAVVVAAVGAHPSH